MINTVPPISSYMTPKEVQKFVGVSRPYIYTLMKEKGFPKPLRIGPQTRRWRTADVIAWMETRPT